MSATLTPKTTGSTAPAELVYTPIDTKKIETVKEQAKRTREQTWLITNID